MTKAWMLCAICFVAPALASAETLQDEDAAKALTEEVMSKVAAGDLDAAFNAMKRYAPILSMSGQIQTAAEQTKSQRLQYEQRFGSPTGFSFVDSKKVGDSLLRIRYMLRTDRHALPGVFYFYKSKEGWTLNSFIWSDDFSPLFSGD